MARPSDWSPLDMDSDPTPGNPDEVRELADELQTFADDVGEALARVQGMADDRAVQDWAGLSAEAFRSEFDGVPGNLRKLHTSYDLAARALQTYWPKLETAQGMADRALDRAITAQAELSSAQSALSDAQDWVSRAGDEAERLEREGEREDVEQPSEAEVRAATRDATAAGQARSDAQGRVDSAEGSLSAARELACQAQEMREDAAGACASDIDEASDAGIQNRRWWEDVTHWVSENWDTIVEVCKVVVAVLGIVVLIIGGPLAWVVLAAALVVLADTLYDYANGRASLWDVAFAALDCIPGMRGLTTLGGLARGLRGLASTGLRGLAAGARGLGQGIRRMGRHIRGLALCGDPVDMATGELVMSAVDIDLPGVLPLVLERHHRTSVRTGLLFGPSWASTLDQRLLLEPDGVVFAAADGMTLHYPVPPPDDDVLPVEGPHWPLSWDGQAGGEMALWRDDLALTLHFRPVPGRPATALPLTAISDRNGNTITVAYDAAGLPLEIVHHGGYRVGITCDEGHVSRLTLLSAPDRPVLLRYDYDEHGDLTAVTNSSGRPLRLGYDDRHQVTGWEDRNGSWYRYVYDAAGRCVATHGSDGVLDYTFDYVTEARTTIATDSLGRSRRYRFNDSYQLVAETDALGNTVHRSWDRRDKPLTHTDELGGVTRLRWDTAGNLTAVARPDGATTRARYNGLNLPVEVTGFDGAVRHQEWDERGNCVAVTEATGATTHFTHDPSGALSTVTDATGASQRFTNDAAGLPVRSVDPLGAESHLEYDAFGRAVAITTPLGAVTRHTWTVEGRLASRRQPDGAVERWTYDAEGNCVTHTDALGRTTSYEYTHFDQLAARTTPDEARLDFGYDTELRLTSVTDPTGRTWSYRHDAAGNVVAETDFDGRTVTYGYDAAGRLVTRVNALGQTTGFAYDEVGQQVRKTVDGVTTTFTHDVAGRLLTATAPEVALTLSYDAAGYTTAETVNGRTLATSYDVLGRPVERTTPAGVTTAHGYDMAGRRTSLRLADRLMAFGHDAAGRETRRAVGDGRTEITQVWDGVDRLTGQTLLAPGDRRTVIDRSYGYRADGTLATLDDQRSGRHTFGIDPAGRVTSVRAAGRTETYTWDRAGNQTSASWPDRHPEPESRGGRRYDGGRVIRAGGVHYEYDAAGRVVVRRRTRLSRKPDVWRYAWDAEDRLTSVTTPDGTRWHYLYDAFGRRVVKRRLADDGETVAEETRFAWDGTHLVEQTTEITGEPRTVTISWGRDESRPLAQVERRTSADSPQDAVDERFYTIVTDLVGTPTELVDERGEIAWHADATLWGLTARPPRSGVDTPLRFPGQYADGETQFHYNFLRHYDPTTARYVTPDPLGLDAGPNAQAYVPDPLSWIDYLGLASCSQILSRNLAREGRAVGPGQAAAHIVPAGLNRGGAPGIRALLSRYRVDINDAANGIPLGHPRPHNFTHTNLFLGRLNRRLHLIVAEGVDQGAGARAIRTDLRNELRSIGHQIQAELATGSPGPFAYWTA
ncbi:DUF6531 domain-containing protein [Streptomyces hainanensis]|uniref:Type IV secretion protein Rhs n=1 Tax=Streptomyces hainanensis TaxID=402648 RepID=A0A4R4TLI6_9ACTN|nr:DUF6531 domain-containing protein [Streptomyces hainanensis]TDC76162.1 hypothetical protein E1283_10455 [Streptomyces hainanensis]